MTNAQRTTCISLALLFGASTALAGADDEALPGGLPGDLAELHRSMTLARGETIQLELVDGQQISGRLEDLTDDTLVVTTSAGATTSLTQADIQTISVKRRDSLKNGLLIGLGVGLLSILRSSDSDAMQDLPHALLLMGGAGAGVDALVQKRRTVYRARVIGNSSQLRLRLEPMLRPDDVGLTLCLRF